MNLSGKVFFFLEISRILTYRSGGLKVEGYWADAQVSARRELTTRGMPFNPLYCSNSNPNLNPNFKVNLKPNPYPKAQ